MRGRIRSLKSSSLLPRSTLNAKFELQNCLLSWRGRNRGDYPWRKTNDPYRILVSEVLLQKTVSHRVARIYDDFFQKFPSVKDLAVANKKEIRALIRSLGLPKRVTYLSSLARQIMTQHGGKVPRNRESLLSLPGVGEYTSAAVLCFAFGERLPIVDTNVLRIFGRFFGLKIPAKQGTSEKFRRLATSVLPRTNFKEFNYALLDLGAKICLPFNPKCGECPLRASCSYRKGREPLNTPRKP